MDEYPILDVNYHQSTQNTYLIETAANSVPTISIEIRKTSQPTILHPNQSQLMANVYVQKAGGATEFYRYIDRNINSFFKNITVYHDNIVIQRSNNVSRCLHLKEDITKSPAEIYSNSISQLGGEEYTNITPNIEYNLPDPYLAGDYIANTTNPEVYNHLARKNAFLGFNATSSTDYRQVCFTLHNILGEGCEELPLHLLKGNLRIELSLNNDRDIGFSNEAGNRITRIYFRDVFYKAYCTYITPQMSKELYPTNEYTFTAPCIHNEIFFIPTGSTNLYINLNNFRYKYAKNIYFFFSNPASRATNTKIYLSQRIRANMHRYYIKHGNNNYPKKPIEGVAEQFQEVMRCGGNNKSLLTYKTYNTNANDETTATDDIIDADLLIDYDNVKRFVGGISLMKYGGMPTNLTEHELGLNIELRTISNNAYPFTSTNFVTTEDLELFIYLEYDCHYTIKNGDVIKDE